MSAENGKPKVSYQPSTGLSYDPEEELYWDEEGLAANLIRAAGARPEAALQEVEAALAKLPRVEGSGGGHLYLGAETARLLESAETLAEKAGDSFVTAERLLLALVLAKGTGMGAGMSTSGIFHFGILFLGLFWGQ